MQRSSFDKTEWRERNLRFITQPGPLMKGGKLIPSYVEMLGMLHSDNPTDVKMFTLLAPYLKDMSQFIGVDNNPCTSVLNARELLHMGKRFKMVHDDYYHVCLKTTSPTYSNPAACFNIDEMNAVGNERWWGGYGKNIAELISRALESHDEALLILNATIDRGAGSRSVRLIRHTKELCKCFERYGLQITHILGRNGSEAAKADDTQYGRSQSAQIGAYQVYKSEDGVLRMVTIRLRFNKRGVTIDQAVRILGSGVGGYVG